MISPLSVRHGHLALLAATATAILAGCGGGDAKPAGGAGAKDAVAGVACTSKDTTPVSLAVLDYIKAASPTPQRFLSAAGTDSGVPDDGFKVLQDKGPTFFYGSDPKAQAQIKKKLVTDGPYASLLVVYHGKAESDAGNTVTVTLGGHYISGEHDGKESPTRQIAVHCDGTAWKLVAPSAAAPAPAAPAAPGAPARK